MDDYYSIIARAVSRLPNKTDEARHAIYERARTALRDTLRNYDPPLSEAEIANEEAALDAAIGTVDVDFLFSDMGEFVKEGASRSPPSAALARPISSFISKLKKFVRSVVDKFK
jgi:hypothetical protein